MPMVAARYRYFHVFWLEIFGTKAKAKMTMTSISPGPNFQGTFCLFWFKLKVADSGDMGTMVVTVAPETASMSLPTIKLSVI